MAEFFIGAAILYGFYRWGSVPESKSEMKMGDYSIKEFSGNELHWTKWKEDSMAAFAATGYDKILKSASYARRNKMKNKAVFAMLSSAVGDGSARHVLIKHRLKQDGRGAWLELTSWYDGENIQSSLAGDLKDQLIALKLKPGMTVEEYINKFKNIVNELNLLKGHRMTDHDYKRYFVKNIEDPSYTATRHDLNRTLGSSKFKMDLTEMVEELHQEARRQRREEKAGMKRPRRVQESESDDDIESAASAKKKIRLLEKKVADLSKGKSKEKSSSDSEKISISEMGKDPETNIITIDSNTWPKLRSDLKSFVRRHNVAARHKDPLPNAPDGVTIVPKRRRVAFATTQPSGDGTTSPSPISQQEDIPLGDSPEDTDHDEAIPDKGISFGLGSLRPSGNSPGEESGTKRRMTKDTTNRNLLIFDTGGGSTPTVTKKAWTVLAKTGVTASFQGYGPGTPTITCPVVHAITKARIRGFDDPVLLKVHHASLLEGPDEDESLLTLMDIVKSGVTVNGVTPPEYMPIGSDPRCCGLTIEQTYLPFDYDDEKLFFQIEQPTQDDLADHTLETFNINGPDIQQLGVTIATNRRTAKEYKWDQIPTVEWTKRLGLAPTEVIEKTLEATTQHYLEVEAETRGDPRRHWVKRFKSLQYERRQQTDATDTIFPSVKSAQGHTCSQFFVCVESKMWHVTPMRREQHNHTALQEHLRKNGIPETLISDNATSETSTSWTKICREFHIKQQTSEPHHPHQNPSEAEIGRLSRMVRRNMQAYSSPLKYNNWCQIFCCQLNNVTARRSLGWRTPLELHTGWTPDISAFRFHWYEPIWYFLPGAKSPKANMAKARFLCLAESSGDLLTYFILTEPDQGSPKVLVRSVIRSRRKNVGNDEEHINNDPAYENFIFTTDEGRRIVTEEDWEDEYEEPPSPISIPGPQGVPVPLAGEQSPQEGTTGQGDTETGEALPAEVNVDDINQAEDEELEQHIDDPFSDENFEFEKVVNHRFEGSTLLMMARYRTATQREICIEVPFSVMKKEKPIETAKYVRNYVMEKTRKGPLKEWADKIIKNHTRTIKRLYRTFGTFSHYRREKRRRMKQQAKGKRKSRNTRWTEKPNKEMFGYKIPNTVEEALDLDRENGNDYWAKAIAKEMQSLFDLNVFKFMPRSTKFDRSDGWQKAPLRLIFCVKAEMEDGHHRHKARFVVGGHRIDSSMYNKYSSTVKALSVRLLLIIAEHQGLSTITADIANAFCTAPNQEQVWAECGPEFGDRAGERVIIQRALYGMASASRSFHDFLGELLLEMGFVPSRADPDLWIRKSDEYNGYDYIATWVDDIICVAKEPQKYISLIEQRFKLRNIEVNPSLYLGMNLKRQQDGLLHLSCEGYIREMLRKYENQHGTLKKQPSPMSADVHPEKDESEPLGETEHRQFQKIIGVCQWVCQNGRMDIMFATSSLSRFSASPRKNHLAMAERILGYLKKYPKRGIVVNPSEPQYNDERYERCELREDFGQQYHYFKEVMDPMFPEPKITNLSTMFFCDSDHSHDLVTGRSMTGIIGFVGCTPVTTRSTRQSSVQTSTFGAELTAAKTATEEIIQLQYFLRSMGVAVEQPTPLFIDNKGVVLNTTNPASALDKKALALAYHSVREHQYRGVLFIRKIGTDDNYADPFTKSLNSQKFHGFYHNLMRN